MTSAAIYIRSSKDRHDLSLDAQRQALHEYAREHGLVVSAEYADAVESGKDDDRPAFQRLLAALKDRERGWTTILALDTSRIARRRHLALIFEHECERAGVTVVYRSIPDGAATSPRLSGLPLSLCPAAEKRPFYSAYFARATAAG
jgi:DNA invertase Pin-like site-specific DNA recombinase